MFVLMVGRQHHALRARAGVLHPASRLHAIHPRHNQIHQRHVGDMLCSQKDSRFARLGFTNHGKARERIQVSPPSSAHNFVVIDD